MAQKRDNYRFYLFFFISTNNKCYNSTTGSTALTLTTRGRCNVCQKSLQIIWRMCWKPLAWTAMFAFFLNFGYFSDFAQVFENKDAWSRNASRESAAWLESVCQEFERKKKRSGKSVSRAVKQGRNQWFLHRRSGSAPPRTTEGREPRRGSSGVATAGQSVPGCSNGGRHVAMATART